jgi:GT2 family glycosyltransferase
MPSSLRISVGICTYNRDRFLFAALESLARQNMECAAYEVILVDNNSTDKTADVARQFRENYPSVQFHYFLEEKQGLSHARNRAVEEAQSELIAFIDDDAIADPAYLENLLSFFDLHPQIMAAGGKILPYFHPHNQEPAWLSWYLIGLLSCLDLGDEEKPFPRYPIGCNMAFRKTVFEKIGLFDPRLGRIQNSLMGSEEKDLFIRVKEAGLPVYYVPQALVYHTIPPERTQDPFLRKVSEGIGKSERLRVQEANKWGKLEIVVVQTYRTAGTLIIALGYLLKGKPAKARMLLKYRQWFIQGFFSRPRAS